MVLSKTLPSFQPHIIPGHLMIDARTLIAGRPFRQEDQIKPASTNSILAKMLVELIGENALLKDEKTLLTAETCSAIAVSGNSPATGEARIAIYVRHNPDHDAKSVRGTGHSSTGTLPLDSYSILKSSKEPSTIRKGCFWKLLYGIGLFLLILSLILFAILIFDSSTPRSESFVLFPIIFLAIALPLMYLATRPKKTKS